MLEITTTEPTGGGIALVFPSETRCKFLNGLMDQFGSVRDLCLKHINGNKYCFKAGCGVDSWYSKRAGWFLKCLSLFPENRNAC